MTKDLLQHHGVKGMKWGVRRFQPYPKGKGPTGKFIKSVKKKVSEGRLGQEVRSRKQDLKNAGMKSKMKNMSTSEIKNVASRMNKENDLKRLSRTKKEKKDYRNRSRMSDQELGRKLERLRAKDMLNQNVNISNKAYKDASMKVIQTAIASGISYKNTKDGRLSTDQIYDTLFNPKGVIAKEYINNIKKGIDIVRG